MGAGTAEKLKIVSGYSMQNQSTDLQRLAELLDQQYRWPADYLFKFVVPRQQLLRLTDLFESSQMSFKESRTGKYISASVTLRMASSESVLAIYRQAAEIEGLIAL